MVAGNREKEYHIENNLLNEGYKFDFFQAVTLLEWLNKTVRLQPDTSLGFPTFQIKEIVDDLDTETTRIVIRFMGLYGISAPLPIYFTELITSPEEKGKSLQDFLDIFNHRLIWLFYQAWKKYRYYLSFQSNGIDSVSRHVRALFGLDLDIVSQAAGLPTAQLLKYTGILSMKNRPAEGLRVLLSDFFDGIPVKISECLPQWVNIPEGFQCGLSEKNSSLGKDLSVGSQVLDRLGKIRVIIGPISLAKYEGFLPGTRQFEVLKRLVSMYVSYRLRFDIEFIVKGEDISSLVLSSEGNGRLGQTTWALTMPRDDARIIFE